jgi:hypothetical protein
MNHGGYEDGEKNRYSLPGVNKSIEYNQNYKPNMISQTPDDDYWYQYDNQNTNNVNNNPGMSGYNNNNNVISIVYFNYQSLLELSRVVSIKVEETSISIITTTLIIIAITYRQVSTVLNMVEITTSITMAKMIIKWERTRHKGHKRSNTLIIMETITI